MPSKNCMPSKNTLCIDWTYRLELNMLGGALPSVVGDETGLEVIVGESRGCF
jgi:hypothetical protein